MFNHKRRRLEQAKSDQVEAMGAAQAATGLIALGDREGAAEAYRYALSKAGRQTVVRPLIMIEYSRALYSGPDRTPGDITYALMAIGAAWEALKGLDESEPGYSSVHYSTKALHAEIAGKMESDSNRFRQLEEKFRKMISTADEATTSVYPSLLNGNGNEIEALDSKTISSNGHKPVAVGSENGKTQLPAIGSEVGGYEAITDSWLVSDMESENSSNGLPGLTD